MSCVFGADIRISRYCLQYRIHIGADIGEKPDIGGGNLRVNRNIGPDIGSDIGKNADIGSNFHDIGGGNLRVCSDMYPISDTILTISGTISASKTRYRYLGRRYRIMSNIEFDIPISGQPVSDPISGPISDPISDIGSDVSRDQLLSW